MNRFPPDFSHSNVRLSTGLVLRLAEQEARTGLLRARARANLSQEQLGLLKKQEEQEGAAAAAVASTSSRPTHVNLFEDLEAGETTKGRVSSRKNAVVGSSMAPS